MADNHPWAGWRQAKWGGFLSFLNKRAVSPDPDPPGEVAFEWLASSGSLTALAGGVEFEGVFVRDAGAVYVNASGEVVEVGADTPVFESGALRVAPGWTEYNNHPGYANEGLSGASAQMVETGPRKDADGETVRMWEVTAVGGMAAHIATAANGGAAVAEGEAVSAIQVVLAGDVGKATPGFVFFDGSFNPVAVPVLIVDTTTGAVDGQYDVFGGAATIESYFVEELADGAYLVGYTAITPAGAYVAVAAGGANDAVGAVVWNADGSVISVHYGAWPGLTASRFIAPFSPTGTSQGVTLPADGLYWPTPATVQAALADAGAVELRLSFGQGVGLLPDGSILSTGGGSDALFMETGNLCASDGVETASVAFEPDYGVEYYLRTEWGLSGLRVGWKLASGSTWTWSGYAEFSGAMPDNEALAVGGMIWPLYPSRIAVEGV